MDDTRATELVNSLDQAKIRKRLDEIDGERQALMTLLRAAAARDRKLGKRPVETEVAPA